MERIRGIPAIMLSRTQSFALLKSRLNPFTIDSGFLKPRSNALRFDKENRDSEAGFEPFVTYD